MYGTAIVFGKIKSVPTQTALVFAEKLFAFLSSFESNSLGSLSHEYFSVNSTMEQLHRQILKFCLVEDRIWDGPRKKYYRNPRTIVSSV